MLYVRRATSLGCRISYILGIDSFLWLRTTKHLKQLNYQPRTVLATPGVECLAAMGLTYREETFCMTNRESKMWISQLVSNVYAHLQKEKEPGVN